MCWRILALAHQMAGDVGLELAEIPVDQAADLGPRQRVLGHQPAVALQHAARLVEIFGGDGCADDRPVALGQKNRQRRRRVQRQEFLAPLPGLLLDQRQLLAIFGEGEAQEATRGEQGMMKQGQHGTGIRNALAFLRRRR
jgi:hypothetical protein